MRITAKQSTTKTLADLYRSIDRQACVTITYLKPGETEPTVRTIEAFDLRTTKSGRIRVHAMCRLRGAERAFYVDSIISYTLHRIGFVLEREEATPRAGHGIVVRSERQLIARELGRDYLPARRITRDQTVLAA